MPEGDEPAEQGKEHKARKKPRRFTFTDMALKRLNPKAAQYQVWDKVNERGIGQPGLSLMVSPGGTKRFRATYNYGNRPLTVKLGRYPGDMDIGTARKRTKDLRELASGGTNPKVEAARKAQEEREASAKGRLYENVVAEFISLYAKPRQRTWQQTERHLLLTCAEFKGRPIGEITKADAQGLLEGLVDQGHPRKATLALAWLRTFWRWCYRRDYVSGPIMDAVELHTEPPEERAPYSDSELRAIWLAAGELEPVEAAYLRLLLLLAPRKKELAQATWGDVRGDVLITPWERTKSRKQVTKKRAYQTPLVPFAKSALDSIAPKNEPQPDDPIFPGRSGVSMWPGSQLVRKLVKAGAPAGFTYHRVRHTVATWLENEGHDEFDRKLVLNHVAVGGATAGYSHGIALKRKRMLLRKWAAHVEGLVNGKRVVGRAPN